MPWHDKNIVHEILNVRDFFNIKILVETGTKEGDGSRIWSRHFEQVYTCEILESWAQIARKNFQNISNINFKKMTSEQYLVHINSELSGTVLYCLDAHGPKFQPSCPLLEELEALEGRSDCCVVVHDFSTGEAGLGYNKHTFRGKNKRIDLELVKPFLLKINPNFKFYHNQFKYAELYSADEIMNTDLLFDKDTISNERNDWSKDNNRKRGVLFALPQELPKTTLKQCS